MIEKKDRSFIASGVDSSVYFLKDEGCIMKIYEHLQGRLKDINLCKDMVELYSEHTKQAKAIEALWKDAPEYLRKINFGKDYGLSVLILEQGRVEIRKEYGVIGEEPQDLVVSHGQRYLNAPSISKYIDLAYVDKQDIVERDKTLFRAMEYMESLITSVTGFKYRLIPENVKMVMSTGKLELVVTDMAKNIYDDMLRK